MSVLVDDLLLLARLDAGRPLSREPVDMTRLAIDATSDAQVARPGHRWVLELPDDPELVLGDEHRLRQVLGNLLAQRRAAHPRRHHGHRRGSATRCPTASPAAGPSRSRTARCRPRPGSCISVTDDGPGIPADLLPDLFERFTRADTSRSHATNASSTGLGLAIVDAVVAAHHGAVLVTSRPGMTRFTIVLARLSRARRGGEADADGTAESQPRSPPRVGPVLPRHSSPRTAAASAARRARWPRSGSASRTGPARHRPLPRPRLVADAAAAEAAGAPCAGLQRAAAHQRAAR